MTKGQYSRIYENTFKLFVGHQSCEVYAVINLKPVGNVLDMGTVIHNALMKLHVYCAQVKKNTKLKLTKALKNAPNMCQLRFCKHIPKNQTKCKSLCE